MLVWFRYQHAIIEEVTYYPVGDFYTHDPRRPLADDPFETKADGVRLDASRWPF